MTSERLQFSNRQGDRLVANIDRPDGTCLGGILFVHCFTCHRNYRLIRHIARTLNEAGFALLRFDLRGLGDSQGEFCQSNFTTAIEDTLAASQLLSAHCPGAQIFAGHSLGGALALAAAVESDLCAAVMTINAPDGPLHLYHQFSAYHELIAGEGQAEVPSGGQRYSISAQMLEDFRTFDMAAVFQRLSQPLLVFQVSEDTLVPMAVGERLFARLPMPKSFISFTDTDHLLSGAEDPEDVARIAAAWVSRCLRRR